MKKNNTFKAIDTFEHRLKDWDYHRMPVVVLDYKNEAPSIIEQTLSSASSCFIHTVILPSGMTTMDLQNIKRIKPTAVRSYDLNAGELPLVPEKSFILDVDTRIIPSSIRPRDPANKKLRNLTYRRAQALPTSEVIRSQMRGMKHSHVGVTSYK